MDCHYCKQRILDVGSSYTPQENFERLAKECCGNCGSGCGRNEVFHPDYSAHTQQVWMESVRWAAAELYRLRNQNTKLGELREAVRKVRDAPNRTYEFPAICEMKGILNEIDEKSPATLKSLEGGKDES